MAQHAKVSDIAREKRWVLRYDGREFRPEDTQSWSFLVVCEQLRPELVGPIARWSANDPTSGPSALAVVLAACIAMTDKRDPSVVLGELLVELSAEQALDILDFEIVELSA